MAQTALKHAAALAVIGSLALGTAGTAMAAPVHHYHHRVYHHYAANPGPAIGAAIGTFFGMAATAAAMDNGYYGYGPYYGGPAYYGPAPFYGPGPFGW